MNPFMWISYNVHCTLLLHLVEQRDTGLANERIKIDLIEVNNDEPNFAEISDKILTFFVAGMELAFWFPSFSAFLENEKKYTVYKKRKEPYLVPHIPIISARKL